MPSGFKHRHLIPYKDRALYAEAEVERLRKALRATPMPMRESIYKDDEWDERYADWWHAHASEAALCAVLKS